MTQYGPSTVVGDAAHQALAPGFPLGKRFKSVEVVRVCDGNVVHLGHHAKADGRWRVYAFADTAAGPRRADAGSALAAWAEWMASPESPIARHHARRRRRRRRVRRQGDLPAALRGRRHRAGSRAVPARGPGRSGSRTGRRSTRPARARGPAPTSSPSASCRATASSSWCAPTSTSRRCCRSRRRPSSRRSSSASLVSQAAPVLAAAPDGPAAGALAARGRMLG